ncbi:hypothetical protein HYV50_03810 [Candidatus Pacearchaeota archaeon]|nr:hypothetical protein [Candidatus Pacearchaeota archaeon]
MFKELPKSNYFDRYRLTEKEAISFKWCTCRNWQDKVNMEAVRKELRNTISGNENSIKYISYLEFEKSRKLLEKELSLIYEGLPTFNRAIYLHSSGVVIEYFTLYTARENAIASLEFIAAQKEPIEELALRVKLSLPISFYRED